MTSIKCVCINPDGEFILEELNLNNKNRDYRKTFHKIFHCNSCNTGDTFLHHRYAAQTDDFIYDIVWGGCHNDSCKTPTNVYADKLNVYPNTLLAWKYRGNIYILKFDIRDSHWSLIDCTQQDIIRIKEDPRRTLGKSSEGSEKPAWGI